MKASHSILPRLSFVVAAIAASVAASADTLTYNFTVPATQTTFTAPVSLGQFNPTLGTLTSITFGFTNTMATQVSLSNESTSSTNSLTGTVNGSFTFKDASNATILSDTLVAKSGTGFDGQGVFAVKPSSGAPFFVQPYGGVFNKTTVGGSVTNSILNPLNFAPFLGTGSLNYNYSATGIGTTTGPNGASPANFFALYATNASATGFVTYNYTPTVVPEPASLAAFALGALGLVRRRKGARK